MYILLTVSHDFSFSAFNNIDLIGANLEKRLNV